MLCEEELVASIKDKMPDLPIHVSDLKAPTAKFVQSYYVRILEELGVDVDELKESSAGNSHELDYPDGYRYVLPLVNLHGALSYVFKHIYVDDFSVLDLIEPSPRRTQFLIKAMDGFHTFADWKAQSVQDIIQKIHKRMETYDQLQAEAKELKAKLNMYATERARREVRMKELSALNEETKRRFLQLKEEDRELEEKIASEESVAQEENQELRELETEFEKLQLEASELQSKIVTSPANLEAKLNHLREEKEKMKVEKQKLLELKKEKDRQKKLYETFLHNQEKCADKLKAMNALCEQIKICEKKKHKNQEILQSSVTDKEEIEGTKRRLHAKLTQLQEEKAALSMQWEKEKTALIHSTDEAESKLAHLMKLEDELTEVKAKRKQTEEKNKFLSELSEKQNMKYDKLYEEKTAKQEACLKQLEDMVKQLSEKIKKK